MKLLSNWLLISLILLKPLLADTPTLPVYPMGNTFVPYMDGDGYVRPIIVLGDVHFGQGLDLPLAINFSSALRSPSPEFGQGWDCPLFDAKIFDVQKNLKRVTTLGGRDLFIGYNLRTDTWKHSYSNHWTGQTKGEDFELVYDKAWKFNFHNGLISSLTTPNGRTLVWNRNGEKLVSLGESGKPPTLQILYDKVGIVQQILLNPDHLGVAQKAYKFDTSLVYAGINKIQCPDGRTITFDRSRDAAHNPVMAWTDSKNLGATLTWSVKTGKILSDGISSYKISEVSPDNTYPRISRTINGTGKIESFYYDQKHGVTEETLADGTLRHIEMVVAPGANYKAIRLVTETKKGKTITVLRRAFDGQGHVLLEATGLPNGKEIVKQYTFDDGGRVTSYIFNGKLMWKNTYDSATGFLQSRELPDLNVKMAFNKLPTGEITESIEKAGGISSAKTLKPDEWQAKQTYFEAIH